MKGGRRTERRGENPFALACCICFEAAGRRGGSGYSTLRTARRRRRTATTAHASDGASLRRRWEVGDGERGGRGDVAALEPVRRTRDRASGASWRGGRMRVRVLPSTPESCFLLRSPPVPAVALSRHRESLLVSPARDWPSTSHVTRQHTSSNCTANPTRETTTKPDAVE